MCIRDRFESGILNNELNESNFQIFLNFRLKFYEMYYVIGFFILKFKNPSRDVILEKYICKY